MIYVITVSADNEVVFCFATRVLTELETMKTECTTRYPEGCNIQTFAFADL